MQLLVLFFSPYINRKGDITTQYVAAQQHQYFNAGKCDHDLWCCVNESASSTDPHQYVSNCTVLALFLFLKDYNLLCEHFFVMGVKDTP